MFLTNSCDDIPDLQSFIGNKDYCYLLAIRKGDSYELNPHTSSGPTTIDNIDIGTSITGSLFIETNLHRLLSIYQETESRLLLVFENPKHLPIQPGYLIHNVTLKIQYVIPVEDHLDIKALFSDNQ